MRIAFYTLGCKVNQYETQIMSDQFSKDGFEVVDTEQAADIYVINSCTVTSSGDKKTKQIIRKLKRQNPHSLVALTGCFPQAFPEEAESVEEVDILQGSYNRKNLLENVKKALLTHQRIIDITPHTKGEKFESMQTEGFSERTRAFVKIEDGCDRYCSYCIIPKARGPIRSKPIEEIISEATTLSQNGYKEVVLVGINLSSYGKELQGTTPNSPKLIDVIELVAQVDGIERIRLGSLEPELLSVSDLDRMANIDKFCDQFHLSIQSGCDETLKRMKRHYNTDQYYETVLKIRDKFKNPSITTDIMIGFPGETDEEFMQSVSFAKKVKFAKSHVFAYSIRKGTVAATMPNQVDRETKSKRSKMMLEETNKLQEEFMKSQVGQVEQVLFETEHNHIYVGYTKNYTKVNVESQQDLCGQIKNVKLIQAFEEHCLGEIS